MNKVETYMILKRSEFPFITVYPSGKIIATRGNGDGDFTELNLLPVNAEYTGYYNLPEK